MKKIDEMLIKAKTKASKVKEAFLSKENGDSQLVVALVLIAVAVGLCILFRNQVNNIMIHALNTTSDQINVLLNQGKSTTEG
jgi:hypothetical protein